MAGVRLHTKWYRSLDLKVAETSVGEPGVGYSGRLEGMYRDLPVTFRLELTEFTPNLPADEDLHNARPKIRYLCGCVGWSPIARSKLFFGSEVARVVNGVVDLGFQSPENPVAGVSLQLQAVLAA